MDKIQSLTFEFLERAIRLYSHVEKSCRVSSVPGVRSTAQHKIANEMQQHLTALMDAVLGTLRDSGHTAEVKLEHLHSAMEHLVAIHIHGLVRIPRPHEPIEIVSYLRQTLTIADDVERRFKNIPIPDVFASERLDDQAHNRFLLANDQLKIGVSIALQGNLNDFASTLLLEEPDISPSIGYVSLPRIDLGNPCRWPSLLHETAHFYSQDDKLWQDFEKYVGVDRANEALEWISNFSTTGSDTLSCKSTLISWLRECWCDAFAVAHSGPAAFFAQLHAFIFCNPCYLKEPMKNGGSYPPAWFRLRLLLSLSEARIGGIDVETKRMVCQAMEDEKKLIYKLFDVSVSQETNFFQLWHIFIDFLRNAFPRKEYPTNTDISSTGLQRLVSDLGKGLPIPSVALDGTSQAIQRAATPAEILLAGWIHRCNNYKQDFTATIESALHTTTTTYDVIAELKAKVDRSDETLKRSLQMAEWFQILNEGAKNELQREPNNAPSEPPKLDHGPGLLSDVDISHLLHQQSLRIIPLIDSEMQVSGSVIDLRLGHNFEIFFSNGRGIIDPLNTKSNDEADSMEVDVDFLQSISIGPGQFILAHTLEYIKLPSDVAAQIEGRSSFARLGLQIHMTANLVEAGFDGCLTLEIANCGPTTIALYPGMRIAQLRFFRLVSPPNTPYGSKGENKYRGRLSHNKTKQFSDWEVSAIEKARNRLGIKS